ncbi:MAG: dCTP deaminase [Candidatus Shapirobacteria bacterium]
MILSDRDLKQAVQSKKLVIEPYDSECLQPSSYDLHLYPEVLVFDNFAAAEIDVRKKVDVSRRIKIKDEGFVLHPGEFILGSTTEWFSVPHDLAGKLEGKSSLGRLGLLVHATAGFVDAGFQGQLTFEIANISRIPIRIYADMKVAQICFYQMSSPVEVPYGSKKLKSKYFGQKGPTESKEYLNFNK